MRRWIVAAGWTVELADDGIALTRNEHRAVVRVPLEVGREVLAQISGSPGTQEISAASGNVLAELDARGVLGAEVVHDRQVLARYEPGARRVRRVFPSGWARPVRALPSTHLRFGHDGPELAGGSSAGRVVLSSTWAVEFSARIVARVDDGDDSALAMELLALMSRAGLLAGGQDDDAEAWEFHDAIFHRATRLDTSLGEYGAKTGTAHLEMENLLQRPSAGERIGLSHDDRSSSGLTLRNAISARSTLRDHSGAPIGRAELSAVLDASLRVRRLERVSGSERAWRAVPTGGALSGLSAVVIAASVHDLARGVYEYDAVSHELAPVSGPAPAMPAWLSLAHRLTGIPQASVQVMLLFVLDYARPARSYDSIVYASALKEVGAALEAMALVSADWKLSFCPMGGGFATTVGLGVGMRPAAVVGEAVLGRPRSLS